MVLGLINVENSGFQKVTKVNGLLSILEERLPTSCNMYNMAKNHYKFPEEMTFYILKQNNGMPISSHWIVAIYLREDCGMDINISAPQGYLRLAEFKEALINSGIVKWDEPFIFAAVDYELSLILQEVIFQVTGNCPNAFQNIMYYTTGLRNLHLITDYCPSVELKPMKPQEGSEFLVGNWKFATKGSLSYVQKLIERNGSAGVFVDGKLAAGLTLNGSGMISLLHTLSEFRHQGFAQMVMSYFIQTLLNDGLIPCCTVEVSNSPSIALQNKIGLKVSHKAYYVSRSH